MGNSLAYGKERLTFNSRVMTRIRCADRNAHDYSEQSVFGGYINAGKASWPMSALARDLSERCGTQLRKVLSSSGGFAI